MRYYLLGPIAVCAVAVAACTALSLSHAGAAQALVPPASISAVRLISSGIPPISSPAVTPSSLQQDRQLLQELLRLALAWQQDFVCPPPFSQSQLN